MALFWPEMAIFGHRQSQQAQMGWTLVEHGWTLYFTSGGVSLSLLDHPEMSPGGPRNVLFDPKWPYLAIGSPSKPKWVGHWLNMVEHCQTHPGGSVWAFMGPKHVTRGPQKRSKTAFFGPKWPYLAISSPSKCKWVEHWLNMVEHGWTLSNTSRGASLGH